MLVDIANEQVVTEDVAIAIIVDKIDKQLFDRIDSRCTVKLFGRELGSRSLTPWIKLNLFLFHYKPDIIHFHLENLRKMVFNPAPKVFTIHNMWTSGKEYPRFQALYAISDGVRNHTKEQGFEATTVWNGIRTKDIKVRESELYHPGKICNIVCVGRLYTKHKGQDLLLRSLALIKSQGMANFHLDMIGDGDSLGLLDGMIKDLGIEDNVTMLGLRDRSYVYQHLCDYDLYVLPSRSEGFGLSVAEAMCAKIPVLVCDLEGVTDVIDGGRLGMVFKTGDVDSLSQAIACFMQNGESKAIINEAYNYAISHFDVSKTAKHYIQEYKKIIQ